MLQGSPPPSPLLWAGIKLKAAGPEELGWGNTSFFFLLPFPFQPQAASRPASESFPTSLEIEETCCWNLHLTLSYSPPPMKGVSGLRVAGFPHAFRHIPKDQVRLHKPCPHTARFRVILSLPFLATAGISLCFVSFYHP